MSVTAKVPLHELVDAAQRELAMRHRVYPGRIKAGKMTEAEAAVEIDRMRALRDLARFVMEHEDVIRAAVGRHLEARRIAENDAAAQLVMTGLDAVPVEIREIAQDHEFMGPGSDAGGTTEGFAAGRPAVEGPAP